MQIKDLRQPVVATKSDWLAGTTWMGFTPRRNDLDSRNRTASTVQRQFAGGYVLEYITYQFPRPNQGFETDAQYREEMERHANMAGRLVAVHKLRHISAPLPEIIGRDQFEKLQDMWSQREHRARWSVAFPIVETYEIEGWPLAREVFGAANFARLYGHQSATLQALNESEKLLLAELPIIERHAPNATFAFEIEVTAAFASDIPNRLLSALDRDLSFAAFEGESEENIARRKRRAAWLAHKFVSARTKAGTLECDHCSFNPASTPFPVQKPRSLLDVHHTNPLAEGERWTRIEDFALLCPTCHRIEHVLLRQGSTIFR